MALVIRKAAVLGAGLMGAQIAGQLANVGIPTYLLDIVPNSLTADEAKRGLTLNSSEVRNRLANQGLNRLREIKPAPLAHSDVMQLITPGNFADDLHRVSEVDWVVEAVVENLDIKRALWAQVESHWRTGTVVSSNTSGLSIAAMVDGCGAAFRRHFLGTHFFNPPRYLRLLEVIPTLDTDPQVVSGFKDFAQRVLGKGVVDARDTPNFIGNRLGVFGMMAVFKVMQELGLGPEEVDAVTGPVIGRPKSATFRTLDLVGLDTFVHVARNIEAALPPGPEKEIMRVPDWMPAAVQQGILGDKARQGVFKRQGGEIQVLDFETLTYRPRRKVKYPSLQAAEFVSDLGERLRNLVKAEDPAGQLLWRVMKLTLPHAAGLLGEIADDVASMDRAMQWGFGWKLGPFETWDLLGVAETCARMEAEGVDLPPAARAAAAMGGFYAREGGCARALTGAHTYLPVTGDPRAIDLEALKNQGKVIKSNASASVIDIGDDVACFEMHPFKQAINTELGELLAWALQQLPRNFRGMVLSAQGENFCVGANLMYLLQEIDDGKWDQVDKAVRDFQDLCMGIKYASRPVVAAPFGLTLGGGYELCAPCARVTAAGETYMGLVEVGAGLIPGGGGTKEMLIRALEGIPAGANVDLTPVVIKVFETIGTAKVATSGLEARRLGYLRGTDAVVPNSAHVIHEAKAAVLALDAAGYRPPQPPRLPVIGESGRAVLELGVYNLLQSGYASEHDALIGRKLARVLAGGDLPAGTVVTEQYLLDLEREAFLSLCGEPKSQERARYILMTGKPLRN